MKKRVKIILAAYAAFNVLLVAVAGGLFAEAVSYTHLTLPTT